MTNLDYSEQPLILASGSARRRDILASAGVSFDVRVPDMEELRRPDETPLDYVRRNARDKAFALDELGDFSLALAADTIVVLGDDVLEKPKDEADARVMLARLSGSSHQVMTGVALRRGAALLWNEVVVTEIEMRELSASEIARYVDSGEPMDKAGSYGIQGGAAGFVRAVRGSYTNVVGLPLAEVLEALDRVRAGDAV